MASSRIVAGGLAAALTIAGALAVKWEPAPGVGMFTAHQDPIGVWEICYGHTRGVTPGMTATQAQCDAWLHEDLMIAHEAVARCIHVPLTPNQRGAFTDGAFNVGPKIVCGSTLQRKANAGDIRGACAELSRWVYAAGRKYRGLENRRADDRAVCWPDFGNVRHSP